MNTVTKLNSRACSFPTPAPGCPYQVDFGSDDAGAVLDGLPSTEASMSAAERQVRQQPLLALSRGYRQRRVTLGDERRQYDDAADAAAEGVPSPHWDLHSVAESMQQVRHAGCQGKGGGASNCCKKQPNVSQAKRLHETRAAVDTLCAPVLRGVKAWQKIRSLPV
jgi:hypothetical protein